MFNRFIKYLIKKDKIKLNKKDELVLSKEREEYINNGYIPWSKGYYEYKKDFITKSINDKNLLQNIKNNTSLKDYGHRLDERVVEYPWIFSKIGVNKLKILDAGSTFNFDFVVNHQTL